MDIEKGFNCLAYECNLCWCFSVRKVDLILLDYLNWWFKNVNMALWTYFNIWTRLHLL